MTADLYLNLASNPPVEKQMEVSTGQNVEFEEYILSVKEIRVDDGYVTLIVQELSQASAQ